MIFNEDLLFSSGAEQVNYSANETIFSEGSLPVYYFQIRQGTVKLNNYHEDGKEIIYSVPSDGHCFAESFLFMDKPYPVNAIAMTSCEIIKLKKSVFLQLIHQFPEMLFTLFSYTAERMYYRDIMMNTFSVIDPAIKIKKVMDCLKKYNQPQGSANSYQFPFTRQQLASLTGLCVETVVRVIKKMEKEKVLKIEGGKIFY
jgi:CRP-like cAMP-binding protein